MPIGQVYTPPGLAAEVLAKVAGTPRSILDPACGDGSFLVAARMRWPGADLFGFEVDPAAADRARERLPDARIEVADALSLPVEPEFDLVAGNPPYAAAHRDRGDRARVRLDHRTARGSYDLAVPFVERAVGYLRPGGWLALVVTNKILVKDYAAALRDWLLANLEMEEVWDLAASPAFPGTAIDVAILIGRRVAIRDREPDDLRGARPGRGHGLGPAAARGEGRGEDRREGRGDSRGLEHGEGRLEGRRQGHGEGSEGSASGNAEGPTARQGPDARGTRIVLGRRDGSRETFVASRLARGPRGRWEVFVTPGIAPLIAEIERHPRLGEIPGVVVRDGVLGRDYHRVPIREASDGDAADGQQPGHSSGDGTERGVAEYPVVGVGRVGAGRILWERPLKRGSDWFLRPVMAVDGHFAEFCRTPKILVRGVARRLMAAHTPVPAVPLVAVRAITGFPEPSRLVAWLNHPLATGYLQVTCRSDRIPAGSYNVSKAWLESLPVPPPDCLADLEARYGPAMRRWLEAFGV